MEIVGIPWLYKWHHAGHYGLVNSALALASHPSLFAMHIVDYNRVSFLHIKIVHQTKVLLDVHEPYGKMHCPSAC